MMTIEEKREKNRIKNKRWRKNNPTYNREAQVRFRRNHPNKIRNYKFEVRYGITLERYNEMSEKQNAKCAICGNPETAKHNSTQTIQRLAVDHCHSTGKIRGLLCQDCNRGIGKFKDDITRLQNAILYLQKHK